MDDEDIDQLGQIRKQEEVGWGTMAKASHAFDILWAQELYQRQDAEYLEAVCSPRRSRSPPRDRRRSGAG
eukprot:3365549-Alexandrium_andersonii.AAC.1